MFYNKPLFWVALGSVSMLAANWCPNETVSQVGLLVMIASVAGVIYTLTFGSDDCCK